jgi:two-component system cell cycle response regulator
MGSLGQILIADPDKKAGEARAKGLEAAGYRAQACDDPDQFLAQAAAIEPDVVLIGPFGGKRDALNLAQSLKAEAATSHIPIMVYGDDMAAMRRDAPAVGIDDILPRTAEAAEITARLPRLVRSSVMQTELARRVITAAEFGHAVDPAEFTRNYPQRPRILAVCENGARLSDLQQALLLDGFHAIPERSAFRAGERIDDERVDAAVIGIEGAGDIDRGASLTKHIRTNPRLFNLPTLLIGDAIDEAARTRLYEAGASIVSCEPIRSDARTQISAYLHMLVARQRLRWTLRDPFKAVLAPATGDPGLRGVYSTDFLMAHLHRLLTARAAHGNDLSIAVLRIDNAPGVREEHGEEAVRILMQQMADWITGMSRIEDCVARMPGDGFALVMPDTPAVEAERVIHRIAGILHQSEFHLTEEVMEVVHVWPSVAAIAAEDGESAEDLLARAEAARR